MKRGISGVIAFLLGVLVGGYVTSALSARAARLYGQMLRGAFALEEERALGHAWAKKDFPAAVVHASCGAELLRARAFLPERSLWDMTFPTMGAFVSENVRYPVDDLSQAQGLALAQLGVVWEELGRKELAHSSYEQAGKLLGVQADAARVSGLGALERAVIPPTKPESR